MKEKTFGSANIDKKTASGLPKTSTFEKIIHGIGGAGSQYVWTFMAMYITVYYTNSVGIGAAVAGTMLLVARFLDGVSDFFFAWLMKRVHWKSGKKITPWFLICAPLLGISLIACFNVPAGLSVGGKVAYIYVTYCFTAAVSYTIYNLTQSSAFAIISYDPDDRAKTSSSYMLILMIGVMIMNYLTPVLLNFWGGQTEAGAWRGISIVYALITTITVGLMGIFLKEKEPPREWLDAQNSNDTASKNRMSFGQIAKIVLSNKYTWIMFGLFTAYYLASGSAGINAYFWMYIHGDFTMELYSNSSLIAALFNLVMIFVTPFIARKISSKKLVTGGLVLTIAASIGSYFAAPSVVASIVMLAIRTIGAAPLTALIFTYIADLNDVISRKTQGENPSEVVAMCSSIGTKIGTGIGSALVGWSLALVGWEATAAVQTEATLNGIILAYVGIPAVCYIICLIFTLIWNPKKKIQ